MTCDVMTCDVMTCDVMTCDVMTCDVMTCDALCVTLSAGIWQPRDAFNAVSGRAL